MNDRLQQIRRLLDELEAEGELDTSASLPGFHALELPALVQEVVDDLQPLLSPYEASFYWYFFRHSIVEHGTPYLRVSTKGLRRGVVKSSYSTAVENVISEGKVREALQSLEQIGAIRKEGEPNREGTLYRLLTPDEIEASREYRKERLRETPKPEIPASEIDFYNVRENRLRVFERDDHKCRYCGKQLTRFTATLDHVKPVAEGGDNSQDNLVTACLNCNSRKHHRPVGDFMAEF